MEEGSRCPKCYEGKLVKPKVFYRIFEGRHPDFICDHCGAPSWKLSKVEPLPPLKEKEAQNMKEEEEFDWTRYI